MRYIRHWALSNSDKKRCGQPKLDIDRGTSFVLWALKNENILVAKLFCAAKQG